jgi:DNA-binding MarR family transcriptional regulator
MIMKGMELLPFLTNEQKELLETSELNYKRFARIYFKVLSYAENELVVKVWQMENPAENYLSAKELVERAKGVFEDILPENTRLHVRPVPFNKIELENFSASDAVTKMEKLGLQPKDLVKMLDIDKSSLSLMLKGERELSKLGRAMLYYFFKYLETNPSQKVSGKAVIA